MKNKSNKKTNKKFRLGLFIKMSVAAMLLISMTISFSSGTAVAEFVKTFSANIDFEGIPSTPWSYYLEDAKGTTTGTYANYKDISQKIVTDSTVKAADLIYEIKLPVSGTGLYNIDFTVDFTVPSDSGWNGFVYSTGSGSLNDPVGCKINTRSDGFTNEVTTLTTATYSTAASELDKAGTTRAYNIQPVYGPDPRGEYASHKIKNANGATVDALNYENYHDYQWKTLAPSKSENVSLAFYISDSSKWAIWSWDLRGLGKNNTNGDILGTFTLALSNISITKISTPDADEPYLDFADTHYVNNALNPTSAGSRSTTVAHAQLFKVNPGPSGYSITGKDEGGKTRTNVARGTYITEATYNSMTMQAEKLVYGYNGGDLVDSTYMQGKGVAKATADRYSNLVSFGIPIKNVKAGKSYRITFDIGFARQGSMDVENGRSNFDYVNYANHDKIFAVKDGGDTLHMESYLYRGIISGTKIGDGAAAPKTDYGLSHVFSITGVTDNYFGRGNFYDSSNCLYSTGDSKITNSNKGNAVTRYNELWTVGTGTKGNPYYGITDNVNNLENISTTYLLNQSNNKYNWYNAVYSTETNGQNTINWITFTNSTFTFTVNEKVSDFYEDNLSQLRWVWALDSLEDKSWYRIKLDNVRIEEVVTYGSNVENNGITFNGSNAGYQTYEDIGLNRGVNGTGQNLQPRITSTYPFSNGNVYAPIYNAAGKTVKTSAEDQRIGLKGYAVCDGGVEKYVWSADGGDTWYDMESQYLSNMTSTTALKAAEAHAESSTVGLKTANNNDANGDELPSDGYICEHASFTAASGDGNNAIFDIVANLKGTPYAGKTGLNIIFAAVPSANPSARCEIIRITNYGS